MLSKDARATPIRVLIVDDSSFMRHILAKYLEEDPDITVVGQARDGADALKQVRALKPDVVTLDVEMPRVDGVTALKNIMKVAPTPIVMLSALTQKGARVTVKALMYGAVDFVAKPSAAVEIRKIVGELIAKIKAAAGTQLVLPEKFVTSPLSPTVSKIVPQPFREGDPLVVIGSSTGGPRALLEVFSNLPQDFSAAVVVVQHMPRGFTQSLAQRLDKNSPLVVNEANKGDRLARGLALVAPGGFHLQFEKPNRIVLDQGPKRNGVRPAVDVSMESAAMAYGSAVIGVVLTGMGVDGTVGATHIHFVGGKIIAEHESTCTIYGMPRSIAETGLADYIVPLPEVAPTLAELVG